jgi:hypothetical protein
MVSCKTTTVVVLAIAALLLVSTGAMGRTESTDGGGGGVSRPTGSYTVKPPVVVAPSSSWLLPAHDAPPCKYMGWRAPVARCIDWCDDQGFLPGGIIFVLCCCGKKKS